MNAVQIDPIGDPIWHRLVMETDSSVFHSAEWLRVLNQTYGIEIGAKVLTDDTNRLIAGLPYGHLNDLNGSRLVALPFSDYCDPLAGEMSHW